MPALKLLVIVLGLGVVVGLSLVIWGLGQQAGRLKQKSDFGELSIPFPSECRLAEASGDGTGRVWLRFEGLVERGCRQILIVDWAGHRVSGRILLPAPP